MPGVDSSSHPAPVPSSGDHGDPPHVPPKPTLTIEEAPENSIVLKVEIPEDSACFVEKVEIYSYEQTDEAPDPSLWEKHSEVMTVGRRIAYRKLFNIARNRRHHFTVRLITAYDNIAGPFSDPVSY